MKLMKLRGVFCVQLVSEEHDESNAPSGHVGPFTGVTDLELTKKAEHVQKNDITVWIDPLDATQEYTGSTHCSLVWDASYDWQDLLYLYILS